MASIWLSHHPAGEEDRCIQLGGWHFCRRCTALWPTVYLLLTVQVLLQAPAAHALDPLCALALVPATVEFVAVHLGTWRYSPLRVWLFTPFFALGLARIFYRILWQPADDLSWTLLLLAGLPMLWAAWRHHDSRTAPLPTLEELPREVRQALLAGATRSAPEDTPVANEGSTTPDQTS